MQHRQLLRLLGILLSDGIHLLERRQAFACCGLNALGNKYLLQRIAENRRADLRAVEGSLRRIQHYQHSITRFIRRHKAHEGSNVLTGSITAACCQLLRRTCFAGNAVALNCCSLAAALADYLFHHLAHLACNLLGNNIAYYRLFAFLDNGSVGSHNFFDDIRLQQLTAVGNRADSAQLLQRRHRNALTDSHRRYVRLIHILGIIQNASLFTGKLNAGRRTEAKLFRIADKPVRSQLHAQLYHTGVDRKLDNRRKRHRTHAFAIPVIDYAVGNLDTAVVLNRCIRCNNALRQSHAADNRLKYRTGLVNHGNGTVCPAVGAVLAEIIRVKGRTAGHTQNFTGVRVHDDGRRTLSLSACHSIVHGILQHILDFAVQRQIDRRQLFLLRLQLMPRIIHH